MKFLAQRYPEQLFSWPYGRPRSNRSGSSKNVQIIRLINFGALVKMNWLQQRTMGALFWQAKLLKPHHSLAERYFTNRTISTFTDCTKSKDLLLGDMCHSKSYFVFSRQGLYDHLSRNRIASQNVCRHSNKSVLIKLCALLVCYIIFTEMVPLYCLWFSIFYLYHTLAFVNKCDVILPESRGYTMQVLAMHMQVLALKKKIFLFFRWMKIQMHLCHKMFLCVFLNFFPSIISD